MAAMCLEMTGLSASWSDKGVGELEEKMAFYKVQQWLSRKEKFQSILLLKERKARQNLAVRYVWQQPAELVAQRFFWSSLSSAVSCLTRCHQDFRDGKD